MSQPVFAGLFAPEQRSPWRSQLISGCEEKVRMMPSVIDPDMSVDEIMRRWPATIRVMIRNRMLCIGCPIGIFHTVADAAAAHSIDEVSLAAELLAAMRSDPSADAPSAFEEIDPRLETTSEGEVPCV